MGLKFKDLVNAHPTSISSLKYKTIVMDGMNVLYQFLSSIRDQNGDYLTYNGYVTSHLIGLFNRTCRLLESEIKLIYVFDGQAPKIKEVTKLLRKNVKEQAAKRYAEAKKRNDTKAMQQYARQTSRLTTEMVDDAKKMLTLMGIPIVQAPSEGEAQCAQIVKNGDAYAVGSQDYDTLLFGSPRIVRNLNISGTRRIGGRIISIQPELLLLDDVYSRWEITSDQLRILAILTGTDYNPGGIKGIGVKKGLKLLHEKPSDIFSRFEWTHSVSWEEIYNTLKNIPVKKDYTLDYRKPQYDKLQTFLVSERGFDADRVEKSLHKLQCDRQTGLQQFG